MNKKWLQIGYGFMICLILMITKDSKVRADVIWEPYRDDFYMENYEDCEHLGRNFTANGQDGSVTAMEAPGSKKKVATFDNGTEFFVSFTYEDKKGLEWGVVEFKDDRTEDETGWIPMKDLVLVYDNISFEEEHESEFKQYQGEFDEYMKKGGPIVFWSYPCSGKLGSKFDKLDEERLSFSKTYEDPEGRLWGYVGYYFGRGGWICISDPTNESIPAILVDSPGIINPSETGQNTDIPAIGENTTLLLILVLVAGVIIITAIIIRIFWRKTK